MSSLVLWFVGIYLCLLPLIGILGRLAAKSGTLKDYYLAGGVLGILPLFFTFYATQYSGNTLLGFAGNAYRVGPVALFSALGMAAVTVIFFTIGRKLHPRAKAQNYITIADFIRDRFTNGAAGRVLAVLVTLVLFAALASYILTNFKAIGLLLETISGGAIPLFAGVLGMAVIMGFYESLGGMRSVVWTDMLQGSLLLIGCAAVIAAILMYFDGIAPLITELRTNPAPHWQPMGYPQWIGGISLVVLFGGGLSLYPHAIQRIYAARSYRILQVSLIMLILMPLFTTTPIVISAMSATAILPQLSGADATDQIIPRLIEQLMLSAPMLKYLLALFMAAALAAIMSTIDSALLSMGSIITQDLCRPLLPSLTQARLTRISRILVWVLMFIMAGLAIITPQSIWWLLVLKVELMIQALPAFIIGLYAPRIKAMPLVFGIIAGIIAMLWFKFSGITLPFALQGIHAGVLGVGINFVICFTLHRLTNSRTARPNPA